MGWAHKEGLRTALFAPTGVDRRDLDALGLEQDWEEAGYIVSWFGEEPEPETEAEDTFFIIDAFSGVKHWFKKRREYL